MSRKMIVAIPLIMIASCGFSPMMRGKTKVAPNIATTCWAPRPTVRPQPSRSSGATTSPGARVRPSPWSFQPMAMRPPEGSMPDARSPGGGTGCPQLRGGLRWRHRQALTFGNARACADRPSGSGGNRCGCDRALQVRLRPGRAVGHRPGRRPAERVDAEAAGDVPGVPGVVDDHVLPVRPRNHAVVTRADDVPRHRTQQRRGAPLLPPRAERVLGLGPADAVRRLLPVAAGIEEDVAVVPPAHEGPLERVPVVHLAVHRAPSP